MLTCTRSAFTLPPRITYLNCGYMSPQLKDAEKVGIRNLRRKRNPASIKPEDFFSDTELLRKEFATLNPDGHAGKTGGRLPVNPSPSPLFPRRRGQ